MNTSAWYLEGFEEGSHSHPAPVPPRRETRLPALAGVNVAASAPRVANIVAKILAIVTHTSGTALMVTAVLEDYRGRNVPDERHEESGMSEKSSFRGRESGAVVSDPLGGRASACADDRFQEKTYTAAELHCAALR